MIKNKKSPKGFSIVEAVENYLYQTRNAPKEYKSKPGIKPSDLSSPCLRKNYYSYFKTPSSFPWEVKNIFAFEAGDSFHERVRSWLKESGFLVENKDPHTGEVPISFINGEPDPEFVIQDPALWIRWSKADGIVRVEDGPMKGLWVLEAKSKNDDKFHRVRGPDRDRYQGMLYAYLLEEMLKDGKLSHVPELQGHEEIRGTLYIYVNRNDGQMKEYWDEKDFDFFANEILQKIQDLQGYVERDELPPKTQDFCNWCNYRDKCAINWKPEKKGPNF